VLVLAVVLFAALASNASAASTPFIAIDLGTLGGPNSAALAVNASGQVVGYSRTTSSGAETHAFSWTPAGGMVDLGTLGGSSSTALAVSASGQVVGYSDVAGNAALRSRGHRRMGSPISAPSAAAPAPPSR